MVTLSKSEVVAGQSAIKPLSLRRNFAWTFAGNVVYAASSWAMLVVLAKLGTPEMVGQFALGLAVTAPVIMFANLQLRAIQATDARREYHFADYFGLRLVMMFLALLCIAAIVEVSGYPRESALIILVIGFGKAIDAISDVIYGLLQHHEQMNRIAVSMMLKGILSLIALAAGLYLTHSVLWASVGWTLASVIVLLGYDFRSGEMMLAALAQERGGVGIDDWLYPRFTLHTFRELTGLALPLGVTVLLSSLNTNIPRYFLERYSGERDLGIFAATGYMMIAGSAVINALGQSASPRLAKYYALGNRALFRNLLIRLIGLGTLLGGTSVLIALVAGKELLTLLYSQEYAEHSDVLLWLMVAASISFAYIFLGSAVTAMRYFWVQLPIRIVSIGVLVLLCSLLLKPYGMLGAAWATVASAVFEGAAFIVAFLSLYLAKRQ
jgi:O-antigen/teichoic acid export membrane protein